MIVAATGSAYFGMDNIQIFCVSHHMCANSRMVYCAPFVGATDGALLTTVIAVGVTCFAIALITLCCIFRKRTRSLTATNIQKLHTASLNDQLLPEDPHDREPTLAKETQKVLYRNIECTIPLLTVAIRFE